MTQQTPCVDVIFLTINWLFKVAEFNKIKFLFIRFSFLARKHAPVCGAVISGVCQIKEISKHIKRFHLSDLKGLRMIPKDWGFHHFPFRHRRTRTSFKIYNVSQLQTDSCKDLYPFCLFYYRNNAGKINKRRRTLT